MRCGRREWCIGALQTPCRRHGRTGNNDPAPTCTESSQKWSAAREAPAPREDTSSVQQLQGSTGLLGKLPGLLTSRVEARVEKSENQCTLRSASAWAAPLWHTRPLVLAACRHHASHKSRSPLCRSCAYQKGLGQLAAGDKDGKRRSSGEQPRRRIPRAALCWPKRQSRSMSALAISPAKAAPQLKEGREAAALAGIGGFSTPQKLLSRCRKSSHAPSLTASSAVPDWDARRSNLSCTHNGGGEPSLHKHKGAVHLYHQLQA